MRATLVLLALLLAWGGQAVGADGQRQSLDYGGSLSGADGHPLPDGTWFVTFRLWDRATGGAVLWAEGQSVPTRNGSYFVHLGVLRPLTLPLPRECWLGIQVDQDPEIAPRVPMGFAAYCYNADMVDGYHVFPPLPWTGTGYSDNLVRKTYFQVLGDYGPTDLYVPIPHFVPFRIVLMCPHAAPQVGDVAYAECVENDGVISCLGVDGSGAQVRSSLLLSSDRQILSVREGHVTLCCPSDGSRRVKVHTGGEWAFGSILY